jgi:tyrosyl-tRNA synthetase
MSISDSLVPAYIELLSAGAWDDLRSQYQATQRGEAEPLALKHALAARVVERFLGGAAAEAAADRFWRVVQRKEAPSDLAEIEVASGAGGGRGLLELLEALQMVRSRGEARRLVEQKAIEIDGRLVVDPATRLAPGSYLVRVGKRRFARVRIV